MVQQNSKFYFIKTTNLKTKLKLRLKKSNKSINNQLKQVLNSNSAKIIQNKRLAKNIQKEEQQKNNNNNNQIRNIQRRVYTQERLERF